MSSGIQYKAGDVILIQMQFTDTFEVKTRPAVILFSELGNIVVAGITSNTDKFGVLLTTKDGMLKDSVVQLNYVFTFADKLIKKKLCSLSKNKRIEVHRALGERATQLVA